MNRFNTAIDEIDLVSKLADMKELQYQNMLLLHALIETLVDQKLLCKKELTSKVRWLDDITVDTSRPKQ